MKNKHNPTDHQIVEAMRVYGGSFIRALASAFLCADSRNRELIKATWAEEWAGYARFVPDPEQDSGEIRNHE